MRLLQIKDDVPYPPKTGKSLRDFSLLREVASSWRVTLLCLSRPVDEESVEAMREFCEEVVVVPSEAARAWSRPWMALQYLLRGRPPEFRFYWSRELASRIAELTSERSFDVVEIINSDMALYREAVAGSHRDRCVLSMQDVLLRKFARIAAIEPKLARRQRLRLHARALARWEPRYLEHFARCIVVSDEERQLLLRENPNLRVGVVPNGIDTRSCRPLPPPEANAPPSLLFVGSMAYRPNVDAAFWFCNEVLPGVRAKIPETEVWIVGRDPFPELYRLEASGGVHVTGGVPEVGPYYARAQVVVVPLRAGGGTRLKILEAMAFGRPVVSTAVGCEGLGLKDGKEIVIADSAEAMAEAVTRLLENPELRADLSERGRRRAEQDYDWRALARHQLSIFDEVAAEADRSGAASPAQRRPR